MKKALIWIFCAALSFPAAAQLAKPNNQVSFLPKNSMFKVDPVGLFFNELRVSQEWRIHKDFFGYISPHGYWQDSRKTGQKYAGLGVRVALRRFIAFNKDRVAPHKLPPYGWFLQGGVVYRYMHVRNYGEDLLISDKTHIHQPGVYATIGKQWTWRPTKDFSYGFMGGLEYLLNIYEKNTSYGNEDFRENWYQFPFSWKPKFLDGFRLYVGLEIGFAFRQKKLHW